MEKNYPDNFIINYFAEGLISSDFLKINDNFTRPLSFIHSHVISFKSAIYGILSLINMNKTMYEKSTLAKPYQILPICVTGDVIITLLTN